MHPRYARYKCRDCEGYEDAEASRSWCATTSRYRHGGQSICPQGRKRQDQERRSTMEGTKRRPWALDHDVLVANAHLGSKRIHEQVLPHRSVGAIEQYASTNGISLAAIRGAKAVEVETKVPDARTEPVDAGTTDHNCTTCEHGDEPAEEEPCCSCKGWDNWTDDSEDETPAEQIAAIAAGESCPDSIEELESDARVLGVTFHPDMRAELVDTKLRLIGALVYTSKADVVECQAIQAELDRVRELVAS